MKILKVLFLVMIVFGLAAPVYCKTVKPVVKKEVKKEVKPIKPIIPIHIEGC
jgi:hypothetical protein